MFQNSICKPKETVEQYEQYCQWFTVFIIGYGYSFIYFMVYLMTLSVAHYTASNGRMINELERYERKWSWLNLRYYLAFA
jgi:hypothetical protein